MSASTTVAATTTTATITNSTATTNKNATTRTTPSPTLYQPCTRFRYRGTTCSVMHTRGGVSTCSSSMIWVRLSGQCLKQSSKVMSMAAGNSIINFKVYANIENLALVLIVNLCALLLSCVHPRRRTLNTCNAFVRHTQPPPCSCDVLTSRAHLTCAIGIGYATPCPPRNLSHAILLNRCCSGGSCHANEICLDDGGTCAVLPAGYIQYDSRSASMHPEGTCLKPS